MVELAHALLSASGSKQWLHCPPSIRLTEHIPEKTSEYAAEGTLAHSISELKVRKTFESMPKSTFSGRLKKLKADPLFKEEMLHYTDEYHDYIYNVMLSHPVKPALAVEKRLDYSHIAPEGFGTGDCIIRAGNLLYVIDFKYGKGVPVSAVENTQMMLYALGALKEYELTNFFTTVKMIVIQPRLEGGISEWECPVEGLIAWGESIKPIAKLAFEGGGQFCAGEHCRWCKARPTCGTRADHYMDLEGFNLAVPPIISNETVGMILNKAQGIVAWVGELEAYALAECLAGRSIKGWKAVEGRSNRKITDVDSAFENLVSHGIPKASLWKTVPETLTAVEALVGKKKFGELMVGYIEKPQGKPTLVVESDKRETFGMMNVATEFTDTLALESDENASMDELFK
jgi:hypothetical protein